MIWIFIALCLFVYALILDIKDYKEIVRCQNKWKQRSTRRKT